MESHDWHETADGHERYWPRGFEARVSQDPWGIAYVVWRAGNGETVASGYATSIAAGKATVDGFVETGRIA